MEDERYVYNMVVELSKQVGYETRINKKDKSLRDNFITKKDNLRFNFDKRIRNTFETPKEIRDAAMFEAITAHNNEVNKFYKKVGKKRYEIERKKKELVKKRDKAKTKKTKDKYQTEINNLEEFHVSENIYKPNIRFRKKKSKNHHICISSYKRKSDYDLVIFKRCFGDDSIKTKEKLPEINHEFKILYKKGSGWYALIPVEIENPKTNKTGKFISLDPGIRTFLTGVDSDGKAKEYGNNWFSSLEKDIKKFDRARSKMDIAKFEMKNFEDKREKRSLRLKFLRAKDLFRRKESKIRNKIDDMHKKIAKDLLNKYDILFLPKLETKSIIKRENSNLNRRALLVSHCKFFDYLEWKCEVENKTLLKADEKYTTMTCCRCMTRNKIGANKTFKCEKCELKVDRDVNASINILNKNCVIY